METRKGVAEVNVSLLLSFLSFWCVLVRHLLIYSKHLSPTNVVVRYRKNKSSKFESEAEESEEVSAVEDEEEKMPGNDD
jgi:hypothetical protein